MIALEVNGQERTLAHGARVKTLVEELTGLSLDESGHAHGGKRVGIALAINAAVVPRSQWGSRELVAGDKVEVIGAVQGG